MFLLFGLSPVLVLSATAVRMLSGRSPFIAHRRVGRYGLPLWVWKLRTMWDQDGPHSEGWVEYIECEPGLDPKPERDPRVVHSFASFCRKHSIDELPQLWHVVRGEMSLVGPRPLTEGELRRHYGPDAQEILEVKPGIAGLWQVSGRARLSYPERRAFDLRFVRNRSFRLYVAILLRTLPEIWKGGNTW